MTNLDFSDLFTLTGHQQAWEKARILPRDVSVNNILIDSDGNGFLNDWDLCKLESVGQPATQYGRSVSELFDYFISHCLSTSQGTWASMSGPLSQFPTKQNSLSDDLESFIHVVTWLALRFHKHDRTKLSEDEKLSEQIWKKNHQNVSLAAHVQDY